MPRRPPRWLPLLAAAAGVLGFARFVESEDPPAAPVPIEAQTDAATRGDVGAMLDVGDRCRTGADGPRDYVRAMVWYEKAVEGGSASAMTRVGYMHAHALGVPLDFAEAMRWYRKASHAGDPLAMNNIGYLYQHAQGVDQDFEQAMKWYRGAAREGEPHAMCNIGYLYAHGLGVRADEAQARKWYDRAGRLGYGPGWYNLARLTDKASEGAYPLYKKAADAGDAHAAFEIARLISRESAALALKWYERAAALDPAVALRLGDLYATGDGIIAHDDRQAVRWYLSAA